jgi:hypothetical protein
MALNLYIDKKRNFNEDIFMDIVNEVFNNQSTLEIIYFLENDYQNIYNFSIDIEKIEVSEKILLDLNNDLVNKYLIRYCKSKNTFYSLLQIDDMLIHQGIFNLNIIQYYDTKLINILLSDIEMLKTFFIFYIENFENTLSKSNYIDSLITKTDGFNILSDEKHIEILQYVLGLPKISNIIEKEKNNNWMENLTEIQSNIWNLICKLEVNIDTIRLLSWISNNNYKFLNKTYENTYSIKEMLEKWSNYNYVEPKEDGEDYSDDVDHNDKIKIQMLISAYSNDFNQLDEECLKYDGVKAYRYKYYAWWQVAKINNDDIEEYIKFLEYNRQEKMFIYFKFNENNYQEKYFSEFKKLFFLVVGELVIENFEKIGSGIVCYDLWDLNDMFDENNVNKEKREYYLNLYFDQKDKVKLISEMKKMSDINNSSNEKALNNLYAEIEFIKNEKHIWLYILLIGIFIMQILK